MNRRTKSLRKEGVSTKVNKGVNGTGVGCVLKKGALEFVAFNIPKGNPVPTHFGAPGNLHKSARGTKTVRRG